jgi:hypothetical protein
MLTANELGYVSALLQVATVAKEAKAEELRERLVKYAENVLDQSESQIVTAKIVEFSNK